jgi:predicted SprT family Zn-dependent metalloprotease
MKEYIEVPNFGVEYYRSMREDATARMAWDRKILVPCECGAYYMTMRRIETRIVAACIECGLIRPTLTAGEVTGASEND